MFSVRLLRRGGPCRPAAGLLAVVVTLGLAGTFAASASAADPPPGEVSASGFTSVDAMTRIAGSDKGKEGSYWVFSGDRYKGIHLKDAIPRKGGPADIPPGSDRHGWGPHSISGWSTLASHQFHRIDALVRTPGTPLAAGRPTEYWAFSGEQYLRLSVNGATDSWITGPSSVASWRSLKQAGFTSVASFTPISDAANQFWVFGKNSAGVFQYARIHLKNATVDPRNPQGPAKIDDDADSLLEGPRPLTGGTKWQALTRHFTTVDEVVPTPGTDNEYWFFSGDQYVRLTVTSTTDSRWITGPTAVAKSWPSISGERQEPPPRSDKHRPVVFVHGYTSGAGVWGNMKSYAEDQGYKSGDLYAFDYSEKTDRGTGRFDPIESIGKDLAKYIKDNDLLAKSPDGTVDIVAHSMGCLVARSYLKLENGKENVKHSVCMGGPNHGTIISEVGAPLGWLQWFVEIAMKRQFPGGCDRQCRDMYSRSSFMKSLNGDFSQGEETPKSSGRPGYPKYTTFRSNVGDEPWWNTNSRGSRTGLCDGVVFGMDDRSEISFNRGGTTTALNGADNIVTPCLDHGEFYNDAWTQEKALSALTEPGDPYAPALVRTECNDLTHTTNPGKTWVEIWMQSCLEVSKDTKTVTPLLRIRGAGHWRQPWHSPVKRWHYVPEGLGDNRWAHLGSLYTVHGPGGASKKREAPDLVVKQRAGEFRLESLQAGPGKYCLEWDHKAWVLIYEDKARDHRQWFCTTVE